MLSHMSVLVTISMTILFGIFLNDSMFHVARTLSLDILIHIYISVTRSYLASRVHVDIYLCDSISWWFVLVIIVEVSDAEAFTVVHVHDELYFG